MVSILVAGYFMISSFELITRGVHIIFGSSANETQFKGGFQKEFCRDVQYKRSLNIVWGFPRGQQNGGRLI